MVSTIDQEIFQFVSDYTDSCSRQLKALSLDIHSHPETGFQEYFAYTLLVAFLESSGFSIKKHACDMDTGFIAEYPPEGREITVGFLSEFDALPKVGHACGHNLIAISGVGAALTLKAVIDYYKISNIKIKLFGSPAEESLGSR